MSKEVANALEELCKLYIEEHRYEEGFNSAKECYEIRIRKKGTDPKDIERA